MTIPNAKNSLITLTQDEAKALSTFIIRNRAEWEEAAFGGPSAPAHLTVSEAENLELKLASARLQSDLDI